MSTNRRGRWLLPAVPLALAAGVVAVCLTVLTPPGQQAHADEPRATAGFQTVDDLVLALDLPAVQGKAGRKALTLELLGRDGKVIEKQTPKLPGNEAASLRVAFKRPKEKLGNLKVRLTHGEKSSTVDMEKILLSKAHETTLAASSELFAGSQASLRCSVAGVKSVSETVPLSSDVTVKLHDGKKVHTLFSGKTGSDGVADVKFTVPDLPAGSYKVEVLTKSALGEEKLERNVKVQSQPKVLLTTDKPLYQPGQTIHIRALALRAFDLAPAGKNELTLEVEDGKGNKVFKKAIRTSDYGVAAADFTLADEVNMGDYRIRAILGEHQSEKNVTVKRYVLPKFKTEVKSDKTFYLPKETIKGELQVDYFFGKPVAGGTVEVKASTFDVAFKEFTTFKGKTDKNGHVKFDIKLPDYFVGTPLAKGNAIVKLDVKVTDTADHSEALVKTYPVSDQAIQVSLIPEAGRLVPGIENRVFAAALYPDGTPAQATVDFYVGPIAKNKPFATVRTNEAGLAELKITPKPDQFRQGGWGQVNVEMLGGTQQRWQPQNLFDISAVAVDKKGNKATRTEFLTSEPLGENVLLRLDKAIYKGGDSVNVEVRSSAGMPTVYLDVVKSGQVMLTRWLDVKNGVATAKVDLPAHLFGTLDVHAYQVLTSGEIVRDSRVVYASPADELKIKVSADKGVYLPGQEGTIRFEVTDSAGKPTAAALGVLVVDEAVYALQDMQPGLEKVYFTLQQELMKPSVQVNFKPRENLDGLINKPELNAEGQQIAQVLMTAVKPKLPARWEVNPAHERRNKLQAKLQPIGHAVFQNAWANKETIVKDRKTGTWSFKPGLLEELKKAKQLTEEQLTDPTGQPITLEGLAKLVPGFSAEQMARKVTLARMEDMLWPVIAHANPNVEKWNKDGKWTLPKALIADAIKAHNPSLSRIDGWGKDIELRPHAKGKGDPVQGNSALFKDYNLTSAGPDGKFGTEDDVVYAAMNDRWVITSVWWESADRRSARHPQLAWRSRLGRERFRWGRGGDMFFKDGGPPFPQPLGGGFGGGGAPVPKMAQAAKGEKRDVDNKPGNSKQGGGGGGEGPPAMRLREYFPETLLWNPSLITDEKGVATLKIPFADSITTWRLTASGSSRGGRLGGVTAPLRVFQDFFVDLDLPVALTQNDEVTFPVAVYNYLKEEQTVTLTLKKDAAYDLLDGEYKRGVSLKAGEVTSVKFRIKAKKVGMLPLQVDARGSKMSDAIKRLVEVLPDGKPVEQVFTDRLKGSVKHSVNVPDNAIDGASRLYVKVYPGVMSQVMEGMEGMLRLPGG